MKRRAYKLLLFLIAGAIINVAVAWGCSFSAQTLCADLVNNLTTPNEWRTHWKHAPTNYGQTGRFGTTCRVWMTTSDDPHAVLHVFTSGWPCRALGSIVTHEGSSNTKSRVQRIELDWRLTGFRDSALPIRPIWPGFAINTIFYAAIVWFLFFAPGAIRRRVRRKRGQCAACGYSLRGASGDVCPECGATA